jgi:hypothetical protein
MGGDPMSIKDYEKSHEQIISQIRVLDERMDSLSPFELAKLEYLYSKAERQAWNIAGHYKRQYKYYEGMAEIAQGQEYKKVRSDKSKTSTDGQYESRVMKGQMLCDAADHEGDFMTWKGIATTYERAGNSIKDMIKAITKEGG